MAKKQIEKERERLEQFEKEQLDRDTQLFSQLCDYFWHITTRQPENGLIDTSKECRHFAVEIMAEIEKRVADFKV
jgi:hypothetical protein